MYKVKTFGTDMKVFRVHEELEALDERVNRFFAERPQARLLGVSDMPVTDDSGATIGMLRVVAYEE
ncbi:MULTISPECIES: hypothetical protein [Deferrisoma]|nr:MAG: hypothetical protein D6708_03325 [Candidatus Dadabacteria bacterium]